jgi:hypothetical protein
MPNYFQIIFLCGIMIGCTPGTIIRKQYSCLDLSSKSLVLAPFQGESEINYEAKVDKEFGKGNTKEQILKYFRNQTVTRLQTFSCFRNVSACEFISPPLTIDTLMKVDNTNRPNYSVPTVNNSIEFQNCKADIVLFINNIKLNSNYKVHTIYSTPLWVSVKLDLQLTFLFWNNETREIVSYGKTSYSTSSQNPDLTVSDWEALVDGAVEHIMAHNKYEKKVPIREN